MIIDHIVNGDALEALKTFPDESVNCCVTSPPYWALRDYEVEGQLGLEETFEEYIENLCNIFDEVYRVLKNDGTCWVNIGDTYSRGSRIKDGNNHSLNKNKVVPGKCLCQIPSRFAIEMCNRGWILRSEIIWHKPNAMPSSAKDRFTVDFEKVFFFVKNKKYWFETQREPYTTRFVSRAYKDGIANKYQRPYSMKTLCPFNCRDGRIRRSVWTINTHAFKEDHFAVFPEELVVTPIKAGCPVGGVVLDPFMGAGTTALVAKKLGRHYIGIELNKEYIKIAEKRLLQGVLI